MKILLIRHGDSDYGRDTLTEKAHREAAQLSERIGRQVGRSRPSRYASVKHMRTKRRDIK